MKLTQHDIGGEIISILTRGMYADPKDAIREYVQNGVDANAESVTVKIRQNNIVIQDNGYGMDKTSMRKAVRLGVSDKNPKQAVGFMGIGLYSSFHLCDKLTILSKVNNDKPNKLEFFFKDMRAILETQKENKIEKGEITDQVALLKLMEDHCSLTELINSDFPVTGTRVTLTGLEDYFFESISKFNEVSDYLEESIPLPFSPDFRYGVEIQQHISKKCKEHNAEFKLVNISLEINDEKKDLYRPYNDSDFKPNCLFPKFIDLTSNTDFLGIAWGCLNKANEVIKNEEVRGFIIKKQGFTIGTKNRLLDIFGAKFFNRYVGEFIIVSPKILPNGARSEFEYSSLRSILYQKIAEAAEEYNVFANRHQEIEKADFDLNKLIENYRLKKAQLASISNDTDKLLDCYSFLYKAYNDFNKKVKSKWKIRDEKKKLANDTLKLMRDLIDEISSLMEIKAKNKKKTYYSRTKVAEELDKAPIAEVYEEQIISSLTEAIDIIGIPFNEDIRQILNLIDENYIKPKSKNDEDYPKILLQLKNEIENLFFINDEEEL